MKAKYLFFLFLLLLVAVFSIQNAGMVRLRFLGWEFPASEALVIFLTALLGLLIGFSASVLTRRRSLKEYSD